MCGCVCDVCWSVYNLRFSVPSDLLMFMFVCREKGIIVCLPTQSFFVTNVLFVIFLKSTCQFSLVQMFGVVVCNNVWH